ncbi:glycoside hydrolase family 3 N-terminal domain-containing protein [Aquimarina sp. 2201CG5-10]|uniref:glycoside hydrolase family 3 N-terminal domain-containing protein n=1 Tax=Aquimarina callyspongiae TaxID=3098150 RepID=UPI002AB38D69|nr:glycoside hydrolase family 3 N-terminal domain-containing protein [Aquimarina sp. 2201CG5-10]MDY8134354.1 glycoside hydrolase family 3 N-terminal domain-containing protein [Aquimarina sp. 2201CG5-10]
MNKRLFILICVIPFLGSCQKEFKNTNADTNDHFRKEIDSLMAMMTLEEKIGQTVLYSSTTDVTGPVLDKNYIKYLKEGQVGAIFNATGSAFTRKLQKIAIEETRLGIPLLFGYDVVHGYKTIFPVPLGESSSWDLELMEKTARIAAIEASVEGLHWTFAPMIDIARDPKWGRISEGAGEDTYLGSKIAKARVKGFQGNNLEDKNTILACAKHYAAYGAAQAGRDYHTVDMSINTLHNVYLPPFKAALEEGVATFMTSFNELNGIPATGNKYLLKDILREKWNFDGFVVTDYTSINEMVHHGYSKDLKHAGELAMNSGVDMDMQGGVYLNYMKESLENGKISMNRLDDAVRAILKMKFKLGLFKDPYRYCNETLEKEIILNKEHLEIAEEAAEKSIILLKNDSQLLPLDKEKKIALIGPLADDEFHIIGHWIAQGDRKGRAVSVKEGFETKGYDFKYSKGCEIEGGNTSGFAQAVKVAEASDVVVMVMGEAEHMSGEAASRSSIKLPGYQQQLIETIKKTGKPVVLVLMNGRPLDLTWENNMVDAIIEAWFPGTSGGHAITNVLFGDYNPSGKLTVTFPRNIGQIPVFYNMKNTGRPADIKDANPRYTSKYIDVDNSPLFPFGYGLSYSSFKYGEIVMDTKVLTSNSKIRITVDVSNTGKFDGEEIVQLYIKDKVGSITRPVKELKGFKKIFLKKGETKKVDFTISSKDLEFYTTNRGFDTEKGDYEFFISGSSDHEFTHNFSFK